MERIAKGCLLISLPLCAFFCITLATADIHEGTSNLTGLSFYCGTCFPDGDSCNDPVEDTCETMASERACPAECSGTKGEGCDPNDQAGSMCKNGSGTCNDTTQAPCEYSDHDGNGLSEYWCDDEHATSYDCGSTYNKCGRP